jgi:hypothetical protein
LGIKTEDFQFDEHRTPISEIASLRPEHHAGQGFVRNDKLLIAKLFMLFRVKYPAAELRGI